MIGVLAEPLGLFSVLWGKLRYSSSSLRKSCLFRPCVPGCHRLPQPSCGLWFVVSRRYSTANAESDYERETERESEEGEDEVSCETVRVARRDSLDLVSEDESHLLVDSSLEEGLAQLLQQADHLHNGDEQEKREGFQLLLNNKLAVRAPCIFQQ